MSESEWFDWLEKTRTRVETSWDYRQGFVVRLKSHRGTHEGNGPTLRAAFECAMRVHEIHMSKRLY